jgi:acetate kinase
MSIDDLDDLLNKRSGLHGLAGMSDQRDLRAAIENNDERAILAYAVYVHRLRAYAGSYLAQLGGADVISFTAGVGENAPNVREDALSTLGFAGVVIDQDRNRAPDRGIRVISADSSSVTVLVVPTDEELEIARQTLAVAQA